MKKKVCALIILFGFCLPSVINTASASVGTSYRSSPESLNSGGGKSDGTAYSNFAALGESFVGLATGSDYSIASGFTEVSITYSTSETTTTATLPASSNISIPSGGQVLNYPNPFNPNSGPTVIGYNLNSDSNVTIYIFNTMGQLIWRRYFSAGENGGMGGINKYNRISWDGKNDYGQIVGNDIYLLRVVADGKVIGKCKIAVLK